VTFLGTGTSQGIPVIGSDHPVCHSNDPKDKRLRVSVLIEINGANIVIDCGPDFRQQMLSNPIERLDAILFTHEHSDHTVGLDDIRPFFFKQGDIPVYAHQRVMESLQRRFDYIFTSKDKYPGAPNVQEYIIDDEPFTVKGTEVIPVNVMHNRLQVYGFRLSNFAYITDAKTIEKQEIDKLYGLDALVINALRKESHHSHFSLDEALEFIQTVQPKRAYLTHISHLLGFHEEIQAQLPKNVFLAYDNLQITL
jgi:phosphoribosyl 1,2-cyclic phosphate phosphodiesterase